MKNDNYSVVEIPAFALTVSFTVFLGNMLFMEMSDEYPYNKNNLKPFSLELAKQGRPVCTRDGRKARIICFDRKDNKPIVALMERVNGIEILQCFHNDGKCFHYETSNSDLMMLPKKKEMWVNIYNGTTGPVPGGCLYDTEEAAKKGIDMENDGYIITTKVSWEE